MTNYVNMYGWTIRANRFSAPIRDGFHYFGEYGGETFAGPRHTAEDVWKEILEIRAEVRASHAYVNLSECPTDEISEQLCEYERASIIALARRLSDPADFDAETAYNGPGRYEGADDRALVVSLDILSGHGCADDSAGSTEWGLHLARFGRYVLASDDRGFVSAYRCDSVEAAQAELDAEDARQNPEGEES